MGKSDVRGIVVSETKIQAAIRGYLKFLAVEKKAKEEKESIAGTLRDHITEVRDSNTLNGDYVKTYRLIESDNGKKETAINVSQID